jgi:hypothetical protein
MPPQRLHDQPGILSRILRSTFDFFNNLFLRIGAGSTGKGSNYPERTAIDPSPRPLLTSILSDAIDAWANRLRSRVSHARRVPPCRERTSTEH